MEVQSKWSVPEPQGRRSLGGLAFAIVGCLVVIAAACSMMAHREPTFEELEQRYSKLNVYSGTDLNRLLERAALAEELAESTGPTNLYAVKAERDMRVAFQNYPEKFEKDGKPREARDVIISKFLPLSYVAKENSVLKMKMIETLLRCDVALQNKNEWTSDTDAVAPLLRVYTPDGMSTLSKLTWLSGQFRYLKRDDIADELELSVVKALVDHPEWGKDGVYADAQHVSQTAIQAADERGDHAVARKIWTISRARAVDKF